MRTSARRLKAAGLAIHPESLEALKVYWTPRYGEATQSAILCPGHRRRLFVLYYQRLRQRGVLPGEYVRALPNGVNCVNTQERSREH